MEVHPVYSDHCRAMGYRIRAAVRVILGEMDVALVNPYRFGQGQPPVHSALFNPPPPANGGHPIPVDDTRSAAYPVDDVHQALITYGMG